MVDPTPPATPTCNVLIVEDDPMVRQIIALTLEGAGHVIFRAAHGIEALECLDTVPIAVVVFDLQMPVMDGPEFRRTARHRGHHPRSLVLSAYRATEVGRELGVDAILDKPFDVDELTDAVARLCAMGSSEAPIDIASTPAGSEP